MSNSLFSYGLSSDFFTLFIFKTIKIPSIFISTGAEDSLDHGTSIDKRLIDEYLIVSGMLLVLNKSLILLCFKAASWMRILPVQNANYILSIPVIN